MRARDRTCRFPACNRRASNCELDHVVPWADGGTTNAANLHALCPRHHHLKHETGWRTVHHPDHRVEWISPAGHANEKALDGLPVDTTFQHAGGAEPNDPDPPPF